MHWHEFQHVDDLDSIITYLLSIIFVVKQLELLCLCIREYIGGETAESDSHAHLV